MGYTHYWEVKNTGKEEDYRKAFKECCLMVDFYQEEYNLTQNGEGFPITTSHLHFNGMGEESHECFVIPFHIVQMESFEFCKTARKPYDTIVVSCLRSLEKHGCITFSSDGDEEDLKRGTELYESGSWRVMLK